MSALTPLFRYVLMHATRKNGFKLVLAFMTYYIYKYRGHALGTNRRSDLKQPKGAVPLLGHMPLISSVPPTQLYQFFLKLHVELGPVWSLSLPGVRMVQIDTPENIEHVHKVNFWNYEKGPIFKDVMGILFGDGIFSADGHEWRFQRKLASNIFSVRAFREYTSDVFVVEGKKVLEHLGRAADQGTPIDFHDLMHRFTLDSFGTISFGESFGCLDDLGVEVPFAFAFDDLLQIVTKRLIDPLWKIRERVTSTGKRAKEHQEYMYKHALKFIQKRREEGHRRQNRDLLQLCMEAKDENGQPISDDYIVDIFLNFTLAGRDTTAQALAWMFYLLHRDGTDKTIAKGLAAEADDVLGGQDPTYETYKRQKFAEACFHESLRLFPAAPRNQRMCVKDDVLPDGTKIYKGERVTWSSYVMGRSERIWGPDALEYKPSRWINAEKPSQAKFNAFHVGPRVCLGQQFATVQALTLIGMLFQNFEFELVDPTKEPAYSTSLSFPMLEGLPVRVFRRSQPRTQAATV